MEEVTRYRELCEIDKQFCETISENEWEAILIGMACDTLAPSCASSVRETMARGRACISPEIAKLSSD